MTPRFNSDSFQALADFFRPDVQGWTHPSVFNAALTQAANDARVLEQFKAYLADRCICVDDDSLWQAKAVVSQSD